MPPTAHVLLGYATLAVVALAAGWAWRWWALRGANPDVSPSVLDLAYLNGGLRLACQACLGGMRRAGWVDIGQVSTIVATGSLPTQVPPLMVALHRSLRSSQSWASLRADGDVVNEANAIRRRLVRRGWVLSTTRYKKLRWVGVPGWILSALLLVQLGFVLPRFSEPGHPETALGLIAIIVCTVFANWFLVHLPDVTRSGRAVLKRARSDQKTDAEDGARLRPSDLMRRVAVMGPRALRAADPSFAHLVGVDPEVKSRFPGFFTRSHTQGI